MFLKWLKLNNIRSYTSAEIKFPEGTTLLSGDIGCGKSTVLLSIEFALFGLIKGELSGNTLLRKGEVNCSVELCLVIDKDEIVIKRILKKKKDSIGQESSYIIINDVKKEVAPIELKAKVIELLGYPNEMLNKKNLIYRYTVYTPQEEMKRIIFESKEDRLNTLRKAFGIDKYKRVQENAVLVMKRLKDQCKEISGFIGDLEEKRKVKIERLEKKDNIKKDLTPLETEKVKKQNKIDDINKDYAEKKKLLQEYYEYKNKITEYDSELQSITKQKEENNTLIRILDEEIGKIEVKEIDVSNKDKIEKEVVDMEKHITEIRERKSSLTERELHTKNSIDSIKKFLVEKECLIGKKDKLSKLIEQLKIDLENKNVFSNLHEEQNQQMITIEKKKAGLQEKITGCKGVINKMGKLDNCPLCLQDVNHEHKKSITERENRDINELEKQINEIDMEKNKLVKEIDELKIKIRTIGEKEVLLNKSQIEFQHIKNIENEIVSKTSELKTCLGVMESVEKEKNALAEEHLEELEKKLVVLREDYKKINENIARIRVKEEKEKNMKSLGETNSKIKERVVEINKVKLELNNDFMKFKDIDLVVAKIEKELGQCQEEMKNIELMIKEKSTWLTSLDEEIDRISKEVEQKENKKKELIKKRQYLDWIEKSFMGIIVVIEKNILASLYNEFNLLFQEWFDIMIEDELITAKLDDEFTPEVQQNGYDIELDNLSGGEKTALSLAYRLALNKVINDITTEVKTKDLIILDEPTDGFSEQQLDKIRDVLERLDMKQIIIVSHESKIESFVDNIIKITKQEHVSMIG